MRSWWQLAGGTSLRTDSRSLDSELLLDWCSLACSCSGVSESSLSPYSSYSELHSWILLSTLLACYFSLITLLSLSSSFFNPSFVSYPLCTDLISSFFTCLRISLSILLSWQERASLPSEGATTSKRSSTGTYASSWLPVNFLDSILKLINKKEI